MSAAQVLRDPAHYGPWALVTGASSGLGECFALALAAQGLNLVLVARREGRLLALAERVAREHPGVSTRVVVVDLSDRDALERLSDATSGLDIGLLICNAGAALTGPFLAQPLPELMANFDLNARSSVQLCHAYGMPMAARRRGGIIIVSSIVGFTGVAGWSTYAAAKASGAALALALAEEFAASGVAVQALCPGHTRTEFHRHARIRLSWPMTAQQVVHDALAGLGRSRLVIPGWYNKFCVFGLRFLPRAFGARVWSWVLGGLRRSEDN